MYLLKMCFEKKPPAKEVTWCGCPSLLRARKQRGRGRVGAGGGRSGPQALCNRDRSLVFPTEEAAAFLSHGCWLMRPTHPREMHNPLLQVFFSFLSLFDEVGLPLLPPPPFTFRMGCKTSEAVLMEPMRFSCARLLSNLNCFYCRNSIICAMILCDFLAQWETSNSFTKQPYRYLGE